MARDYTNATKYESSPLQIKRREERNKARRLMIAKHGKAALKGKDVDHKDLNTAHNNLSNLRIQTVHTNRSRNPHHLGKH